MQVGKLVDDFEFDAYHRGSFVKGTLADHQGKWVVLFFYPEDFTFVCPTEIRAFAKKMPEFEKEGAVIIGASTDSLHSHKAWFERDFTGIEFPIISDASHRISSQFEVLQDNGTALRGTFIIDPEGVLRYQVVSDDNVGRSVEETLRVVKALKTGEKCPVEWSPGEKTLGK